jgi:hypothetical protein
VGVREVGREEAVRAGRVLFGPAFGDPALAAGRWRIELKGAFRRRAMETHPDRARALGRSEADLAREFEAVRSAYGLLSALAGAPVPRPRAAPPRPAPAPPARPAPRGRDAAPLATGPVPQRRLRLAEFLYYSGRVRWSDFVEAVAWQRAQRPPLGRVLADLGFLAPGEVAALLARRRAAGAQQVPLATWAVRCGALTPFQRLAALGRQARLEKPIGAYFLERGLLGGLALADALRALARHNARFPGDPTRVPPRAP